MKKNPEGQDLPKEIDFTGGVRGKYAGRYREGVTIRERSTEAPPTPSEAHSWLGMALREAQTLEATIVAYLALVQDLAVREAGTRAHDLLEHRTNPPGEAAGTIFEDRHIEERFDRLTRERNWLMHHCHLDLEVAAGSPERAQHLAKRLSDFVSEAGSVTDLLKAQIQQDLSRRGLTPSDIEAETRQVIESWAAA